MEVFVERPAFKGRNYRLGYTCGEKTVLTDDPNHHAKQITPTITSGLWYQLGVTVGNGKVVFYVDGVAIYEEPLEEVLQQGIVGGRVGINASGDAAFAGNIESLRISPHVLTPKEMRAAYEVDLGKSRLEANRDQLLTDFPDARPALADESREWISALESPRWCSKAWNWQLARPEAMGGDDPCTVVAAFDSPDKQGADVVCDGVDDDIDIQQALDSVPDTGGKVVLREGTYRLGSALRPQDHTELQIDGLLRVDNALTSKITLDVKRGENTYHVADSQTFRIGQWVTAVDDHSIDHKEGWSNWRGGRKYGRCGVITAITGDAIEIEDAPSEYGDRGNRIGGPSYRQEVLVEANAMLTTSHSAILVQGKQDVYIHGTGCVLGNRMQQERTAPTSNWQHWEEMRANSGIVVFDSCFVRIEGLQVCDAALHNVTFWMTENCTAEGLDVFGANDKNIAAVSTNRLRLFNNHAHDSVCEDGIIFYVLGHSGLVGRNRVTDNPRHGLRMHGSCRFMTSLGNIDGFNRVIIQ
jgi:hypothetical protein